LHTRRFYGSPDATEKNIYTYDGNCKKRRKGKQRHSQVFCSIRGVTEAGEGMMFLPHAIDRRIAPACISSVCLPVVCRPVCLCFRKEQKTSLSSWVLRNYIITPSSKNAPCLKKCIQQTKLGCTKWLRICGHCLCRSWLGSFSLHRSFRKDPGSRVPRFR
jgi:hypothetical protein